MRMQRKDAFVFSRLFADGRCFFLLFLGFWPMKDAFLVVFRLLPMIF
jgi:hypothetical protein